MDESPKHVAQSLDLLEAIFASGPVGFAFLDRDFRFIRLNERLAEINDQPVEAHLGRTVDEVPGPHRWPERRAVLEQALAGQATVGLALSGDGGRGAALASYFPVRANGQVAGIVALMRDITEQAAAEEALRESEARKATILEAALDCIITIDDAGRIVEFNPAAEKTFGYTREEAHGQVMAELIVPPDLRPSHYQGFSRYFLTGDGPILRQRIEVMAMRRSGETFPVELAVVPLQQNGKTLFTAYLRDISDRRRDEAERERLRREVEAFSDRQRAFLRDVLFSVTEGKLFLCHSPADLPVPLPAVTEPIPLSHNGSLREVRRCTEAAALARGYAGERWYDLVIAASEAAMNAVVHAGGGEGQIRAGEGDGPIQVWVQDNGAGIDISHLPRATLEKGYTTAGTLGHGMKMMLQTADRIFLLTGATGTTVVLEQDRIAPATVW